MKQNTLQPKIVNLEPRKLVGKHLKMSLTNNKTGELWKSFMPQRGLIPNSLNNDLISMQVYNPEYFSKFSTENEFVKWATIEVNDFNNVPADMETFTLTGGLYAVFHYKGSSTDRSIFHYIFAKWLPNSGYLLDGRPHFEVLGEKYKNADPGSEEEIWIPVRKK